MIKANLCAHTNIEWICSCGAYNEEEEGQLDIDDGDYIFCHTCNKEFQFNKTKLQLEEVED